jgi:streptomycin 6-kinase
MHKEDLPEGTPADLVLHVTSICREPGERWLSRLQSLVREIEREWSIDVGPAYAAGEFNFVAAATHRDGSLAVLKICPPYENAEFEGEAAFLESRDGRGTVRLLSQDVEQRAILLERAVPGLNLAEIFTGREPECVPPAIDVLKSIIGPSPTNKSDIKMLDAWFDGLRKRHATTFPANYTAKALDIYETLSGQPGRTYFLHGDFHPGNIVSATRSPYLAIDPKGIIGHIGYDIGVFLNNMHWWQEREPDIQARLERSITQFADAFDIDPVELRQWAFAQMVLGASWSFDEMPEHYDASTVAKADVWVV